MSVRRRMSFAALLLALGMFGSRILGYVRDAIIAATYGATTQSDVFWASFTVPDLMKYMLDGGALTLVFLPMFADLIKSGREDDAWDCFGVIATTMLVVASLVTLALWLAAPAIVPLMVPGFTPEEVAQTVRLTRIVLPAQIFFMIGGLINATLQTSERFVETALAGLVYNAFIIAGGLIGGPELGIEGFSWGALAGAVAQCGLFARAAHKRGLRFEPRFGLVDPTFLTYLWRSIPVLLGFSLFMGDEWITRWLASSMESGSITWLQNARRLMLVPTAMIAFATAAAALPYLTALHSAGKPAEAAAVHAEAIRVTGFLMLLAAAWLGCASEPIIGLFFERRAYLPADTVRTAQALSWYSTGLLFWGLYVLVGRGFYAMQVTWLPMLIATVVAIATLPVYFLLGDAMGHRGLALTSTIGMGTTVLALLLGLDRINPMPLAEIAVSLLRSAAVCGVGAAAGWFAGQQIEGGYLLRGLVISTAVGVVSIGLAIAVRLPELDLVAGRLMKRLRRG